MSSEIKEVPTCEVCQKPANQTCGGCKLVVYCSKAHQKLGWREGHKFKCCAFKVKLSDTFGRHMVATRDIKPGEMILKEKPAVFGPKIYATVSCLSCGKVLEPMKIENKLDFYKCSKCNWPMCGRKCEVNSIHANECKVMCDRKYECTIKYESMDKREAAYCVIAPLRVLLMRDTNPLQYENIMNLVDHLEERINTPLYVTLKANLVTFIVQVLGMSFDEETILKIASIFDTNAFEIRSPDGSIKMRGIYVTASMMNHSCKANTRHVFLDNDYKLALIATVPIAKGDQITATYTQSLWATIERRRHLLANKIFDCVCERCKDPTELGTYMGSIYCSICNGPGLLEDPLKRSMLIPSDPLDENSQWNCEQCDHTIQSKQILWGNNALKQELNKLDKHRPDQFEDFILKYSQTLHPTNHLVVQAKLALTQIYGNYKGYQLCNLPDHLLHRKIFLCQELLDLASKIEPGCTRLRGTLLLELQAANTNLAKREFKTDKLSESDTQVKLEESMSLLQEAADILGIEPHMQPTLMLKIAELSKELINKELPNENDAVEV